MKTKEEALCTMKGIEALLIALSQYTEKMECDPDALFVLSKSLTECREYFEENQLCKRVPIFIRWDTQGMEEVKEQVIKEQREGFFASSIEFIKRIIGKEGSYMEKKYSKKEHDKCQRVADAFSELYEMYGDMCVVDAGKFGFAFLKWYGGESFDGNSVYQDSKELFDDLWQMWLDYKILDSVAGTEREDIDYKKIYEELSAETQKEYEEKRQQFLRLSGLCD